MHSSTMSRAALLGCTALALLFSVGAAHAQQGNLPTPVQKLPAHPPVVCVAPNWATEPCESRQPKPELSESEPKMQRVASHSNIRRNFPTTRQDGSRVRTGS